MVYAGWLDFFFRLGAFGAQNIKMAFDRMRAKYFHTGMANYIHSRIVPVFGGRIIHNPITAPMTSWVSRIVWGKHHSNHAIATRSEGVVELATTLMACSLALFCSCGNQTCIFGPGDLGAVGAGACGIGFAIGLYAGAAWAYLARILSTKDDLDVGTFSRMH